MDISLYVKGSRLPLKTLRWMAKEKMIQNPLSKEDLIGLALLEKVWGKSEFIRSQLVKYSKRNRQKLIETADLKTKWERYAYSRLINLPARKNLSMNKLVSEIELTFDFTLEHQHIKRLYKIKKKVYNQRENKKEILKRENK